MVESERHLLRSFFRFSEHLRIGDDLRPGERRHLADGRLRWRWPARPRVHQGEQYRNGHRRGARGIGRSHFQTRIFESGTTFAPETDGTWLLKDFDHDGRPDLIFIKT